MLFQLETGALLVQAEASKIPLGVWTFNMADPQRHFDGVTMA